MNRAAIEIKLNRERAWLLETLAEMSEDLYALLRGHLQGDRGMEKRVNADGTPQSMEQIVAANAGHGRMHFYWAEEGPASAPA